MSNHDPHMGRSLYEEITFHDEIDDDFCRAITEAYRGSNMRVVLQADHIFRRLPEPVHVNCPSPKRYERIVMSPPDTEGILLDGRIAGARMIPVKEYVQEDESGELYDAFGEYRYKYLPYAVLSDVVTIPASGEEGLAVSHPDEEVWVPIEIKGMTLYQPAQ